MPVQHPRLEIDARIGATTVTTAERTNARIGGANGDTVAKEEPRRSGTSAGGIAANTA